MDIVKDCERLMKNYSYGSQDTKEDPTIIVKLFDCCGSWTWYLTEYEPIEKIAFGYVSKLVGNWEFDEWGWVSIQELSQLKLWPIKRIERDIHFKPKPFSQLKLKDSY